MHGNFTSGTRAVNKGGVTVVLYCLSGSRVLRELWSSRWLFEEPWRLCPCTRNGHQIARFLQRGNRTEINEMDKPECTVGNNNHLSFLRKHLSYDEILRLRSEF